MDTIKYVLSYWGYNPAVADTPEFAENLQVNTPCNSFISSVILAGLFVIAKCM